MVEVGEEFPLTLVDVLEKSAYSLKCGCGR